MPLQINRNKEKYLGGVEKVEISPKITRKLLRKRIQNKNLSDF